MSRADIVRQARSWRKEHPLVTVYCDMGHPREMIDRFQRLDCAWVSHWDTQRDDDEKKAKQTRRMAKGRRVGGDLEQHVRQVEWVTRDLTCQTCKRGRRHVTYQRRADEFDVILSELAAAGLTEVTPTILLAYETRRGDRR